MVYRELLQMEWLESSTVPSPNLYLLLYHPCESHPMRLNGPLALWGTIY